MFALDLPDLDRLSDPNSLLVKFAAVIAVLLVAGVAVRIITRVITRTYWRKVMRMSPEVSVEIRRSKRQQTIATLLNSLVRYLVFGAAIIIVVGILFEDAGSALYSASLLIIVVGFGLQRLLGDMVSGTLLLFEGHYSVGDFLCVHQQNVGGVVEEFTLRTTTLRAFNGDRITVLNGSITSFTRVAEGYRDFIVEFFVSDVDAARLAIRRVAARVAAASAAEYLHGPQLLDVQPVPGLEGAHRCRMRAVVPPTLDHLVEVELPLHIERALGDVLDGPISVHEAQDSAYEAYRRTVIVKK